MNLTKTDYHEQSLRMDKETSFLLREAFNAMLENQRYPVEMRDRALALKRMLEDPDREDKPAIFQKAPGIIINCPDCAGSRLNTLVPEDRNDEIEFEQCPTCKGEGQLYQVVIRKMYIPQDFHRRKLAK